jgi:hypothetical protein
MNDLTTIIKSETERAFNVGKNIGRVTERERILNLIAQWRKDTNWTRTHFEYDRALSEVEKLIKGEPIDD